MTEKSAEVEQERKKAHDLLMKFTKFKIYSYIYNEIILKIGKLIGYWVNAFFQLDIIKNLSSFPWIIVICIIIPQMYVYMYILAQDY